MKLRNCFGIIYSVPDKWRQTVDGGDIIFDNVSCNYLINMNEVDYSYFPNKENKQKNIQPCSEITRVNK